MGRALRGGNGEAERPDPERQDPERQESGHSAMGEQQRRTLRRAVRLEWITIAWMTGTVVLVGLVAGQSQAMRAAWAEDALSLLPPVAFLVATRFIRRPRSREHPYGHHRAIGVAHLVAALALLGMGTYLAVSSAITLITAERPPVGLVVLLGQPLWAGWLMIAVMAVTSIGPVILGRMKKKLAEDLHDKVLSADGDMGAADWKTAISTIVGVLGIGIGWWWADAVAAIIVSISIVKDGVHNLWSAIAGLTDTEARTVDDSEPHPLTLEVEQLAMAEPWVGDAAARVRDLGHLFHVELFVAPHRGATPDLDRLDALQRAVSELDWKLHDVVVVPVRELPISQTFRSTLRD